MSNTLGPILNKCLEFGRTHLAHACLLCGARTRGPLLCGPCQADLPHLPAGHCPQCALPTPGGVLCGACLKRPPAFERTRALYRYGFPADVLITRLKYGGEMALARELAERLAESLSMVPRPDLILPMPQHAGRMLTRGFNQAALIGGHLSRLLDIPMLPDGCRRVRDTPPQVEMSLGERRKNVRGAFVCLPGLGGKRVALLDDVMTSGASMDELARAVRGSGAFGIEAWVVARAVGRRF